MGIQSICWENQKLGFLWETMFSDETNCLLNMLMMVHLFSLSKKLASVASSW